MKLLVRIIEGRLKTKSARPLICTVSIGKRGEKKSTKPVTDPLVWNESLVFSIDKSMKDPINVRISRKGGHTMGKAVVIWSVNQDGEVKDEWFQVKSKDSKHIGEIRMFISTIAGGADPETPNFAPFESPHIGEVEFVQPSDMADAFGRPKPAPPGPPKSLAQNHLIEKPREKEDSKVRHSRRKISGEFDPGADLSKKVREMPLSDIAMYL